MKLMKKMKMCLKYRLLFTIPYFREPDEKKIEVEDERGRKEENSHNPVFFVLSQSTKFCVFDLIQKQGKQHITVF